MRTETISYLKKHAANLNVTEPLLITQNGLPAYVIESVEERTKRDEALSLLKLLTLSDKDLDEGNLYSLEQVLKNLENF